MSSGKSCAEITADENTTPLVQPTMLARMAQTSVARMASMMEAAGIKADYVTTDTAGRRIPLWGIKNADSIASALRAQNDERAAKKAAGVAKGTQSGTAPKITARLLDKVGVHREYGVAPSSLPRMISEHGFPEPLAWTQGHSRRRLWDRTTIERWLDAQTAPPEGDKP